MLKESRLNDHTLPSSILTYYLGDEMNWYTELLLTLQLLTALIGIATISLIVLAVSSVKRTRMLGKRYLNNLK